MLSNRKNRIVAVTGIIIVLASLYLWHWRTQCVPRVYLPDGSTATLLDGQVPDIRWRRFERTADPPSSASRPKKTVGMVTGPIMMLLGKLHWPVPNPPRMIDLVGNVEVFPNMSGKTYLVAEELLSGAGSNWVCFKFGGDRDARSPRAWVQANLDCIRTNGVVFSALEEPHKIFSTTLCAVVVDRDSVRILPAHRFGFVQESISSK